MATATTNAERQEGLDWEAIWRPRGAIFAALSALCAIGGAAYSISSLKDQPAIPILNSLTNVEAPGPVGDTPSVRTPLFEYFVDHKADLLIGAIVLGLATVFAAGALFVLGRSVMLRSERYPGWVRVLPFVGAGVFFVGSILLAVGTGQRVDDYLASDRTVDTVDDLASPTIFSVGGISAPLGGTMMAAAYVMTCLNAMRTGLLPRMWGILGIFAGVMLVFPVAALSQLLQPIFLIVLALIFIGRYPGVKMPAWDSGEAEPWPSAADEAAAKREAREAKKRGGKPAPPDPEPVERVTAKPHPSSKKRKRKRRG
jgi:hypothetical protein